MKRKVFEFFSMISRKLRRTENEQFDPSKPAVVEEIQPLRLVSPPPTPIKIRYRWRQLPEPERSVLKIRDSIAEATGVSLAIYIDLTDQSGLNQELHFTRPLLRDAEAEYCKVYRELIRIGIKPEVWIDNRSFLHHMIFLENQAQKLVQQKFAQHR
jgi:hypothetical protein